EVRNVVYLEGHVKMPGRYEFKPGMRVSDLISSFDDLLPEPFLTHAQIIRKTSPDFSEEALSFDLGRLLKGDRGQDPELMEGDRIVIHSREEMGELPKVIIKGEVNLPGEYRLLDNMKVKDLIYMAGNLTPNAYKREAEITRLVKTETEVKMSHIVIDLKDALNGSPKDNIPLMENDTLYIRKIPNLNTYGTVKILGQVKFPGEYPLERGERLSTLIRRAGGYTEDAYIEGAYLIKESARKEQQARFDQFVKELEQQMFQEALNMGKSLPGQAGLTEAAAQYQRAFIAGLKTTRVQGKVAINLAPLEELEGSEHDILLEPGDILQIPTRPATVNVVGRVYNQMAISYREGEDVDYYLSMVGGMRKDADKDSIYLIRCNGTVVSKSHKGKGKFIHWDEKSNRWVASGASKNFLHTEVRPGDTIVVPAEPRVSKVSVLFATKDIASMISQTLLSLAALTAIF
ncbi:MAG TPA: polysaccharide biosynthesis protein, partial [Syntrophaceae bacterium]|nr:polysaccharide biosynthesis protein [Syntrophaceae bacterium]